MIFHRADASGKEFIVNKYSIIIALLSIEAFTFNAQSAPQKARQHVLMDDQWQFIQSDAQGAEKQGFDDTHWRTLDLPHDWSIEGEFREDATNKRRRWLSSTGIGWYRKHFRLSADPKEQKCVD